MTIFSDIRTWTDKELEISIHDIEWLEEVYGAELVNSEMAEMMSELDRRTAPQ